MNRYLKLALPIGLGCTLLSCMLGGLYLLVISMHALDPTAQLPSFYFQKLNFPALAVLLPIVGIVALLPLALRLAFAPAPTEETAQQPAHAETSAPDLHAGHLKAA